MTPSSDEPLENGSDVSGNSNELSPTKIASALLHPTVRSQHPISDENLSGVDFQHEIESAYAEVVRWRYNLFQILSGAVGNKFVSEFARSFQAYADASSLMRCYHSAHIKTQRVRQCQVVLLTFWMLGRGKH